MSHALQCGSGPTGSVCAEPRSRNIVSTGSVCAESRSRNIVSTGSVLAESRSRNIVSTQVVGLLVSYRYMALDRLWCHKCCRILGHCWLLGGKGCEQIRGQGWQIDR